MAAKWKITFLCVGRVRLTLQVIVLKYVIIFIQFIYCVPGPHFNCGKIADQGPIDYDKIMKTDRISIAVYAPGGSLVKAPK